MHGACSALQGKFLGYFRFLPVFLGWILPLGWVSGWVGGMGRFGMISPHGLAPFQLGIWTGPFPSPIVPRFTQSDAVGGYKVQLCVS